MANDRPYMIGLERGPKTERLIELSSGSGKSLNSKIHLVTDCERPAEPSTQISHQRRLLPVPFAVLRQIDLDGLQSAETL